MNQPSRMSRVKSWPVLLLVVLAATIGCARSPEAQKARHLERGDKYFARTQYQEALIEYWNVLRVDPAHPQAVRQAGLAHYHLGAVRRDSASGLPALSASVLDDALRSGST